MGHELTSYSMRMHQIPKKWQFFWSKIEFFGLQKAVEGPPLILGVLNAKKHVVWAHR